MPRATLPPTPASSTDIPGQDGTKHLASLQMSFELPPPAMTSSEASRPHTAESRMEPASPESSRAAYPLQAAESVKYRRRSSAAQGPAKTDSFALPPPPTRSRKIIQMKPRAQDEPQPESATSSKSTAGNKAAALASSPAPVTTTTNKRKQPSATSAAGRKIARKTAHSLIERRRRSKMNEEFAVLKGMIPACTGEMHKLAILQASIEYVRYLEDCVTKLKAQREGPSTPTEMGLPSPAGRELYHLEQQYPAYVDQPSPDVEMTGSEMTSPASTTNPARTHQPSISPALLAEDSRRRHESYSSTSTDQRPYSYSTSATTSPAFEPQGGYPYARSNPSIPGSTLTSPALPPQRDLDQEATAALLMLNNDRRAANGSNAGRGMSVRDLLST